MRHAVWTDGRWEEVVDPEGLSRALGVARHTPHTWMARGILPPPAYRLGTTPWWRLDAIRAWADETGRRTPADQT